MPPLTLRGDPSMGPSPWCLWDALQAPNINDIAHRVFLLSKSKLKLDVENKSEFLVKFLLISLILISI